MARTPSPCLCDVLGDLGVGAERGGEDEADFALLEDVGGAVAKAGLGAGVGDELHAEGGAVEVGGLAGVADVELDVVGAVEGEEVGDGFRGLLGEGGHGGFSFGAVGAACVRPLGSLERMKVWLEGCQPAAGVR